MLKPFISTTMEKEGKTIVVVFLAFSVCVGSLENFPIFLYFTQYWSPPRFSAPEILQYL